MKTDSIDMNLNGGFSLFELLVVLFIIGMISAMVMPRFSGSLENINLRTSARHIAATLRKARNDAVSRRIPMETVFDLENARVTLKPFQKRDPDSTKKNPSEMSKAVFSLPEGIRIIRASSDGREREHGELGILFFPTGGSSGGNVLIGGKTSEDRMRVQVDFITGTVRLSD